MARRPIDKARIHRVGGAALARYIRTVHRSTRRVTEPADLDSFLSQNHPLILAMWHGQFMMLPTIKPPGLGVRIMVARHGDAATIGEALTRFDMQLIRGAGAGARQKDRGGATALREALRSLSESYSVAMTADVPPGPARVAGAGIVTLGRLSGRPIIPAAVATTRYRSLDTWSRFTINLPFGTIALVAGEPIVVPRDLDPSGIADYQRRITDGLDVVTQRAYVLAGADIARSLPQAAPALDTPPATSGWRLAAYRRSMSLAEGLAPAVLRWRERRGKEDPTRRDERFGRTRLSRPAGHLVWAHAASVGETNAILPLIDALRDKRPGFHLLLTTGTVTSAAVAQARLQPGDIHQYIPIDSPEAIRRFLDHWQPDLTLLTESEIWPNLILETAERRIPIALVNGRLSVRSYRRWSKRPDVSRPIFSRLDLVLAQTEKIGRWFQALGCRRVETSGNLKIDAPGPLADRAALSILREALAGRPVLVAASTHAGEESIIAQAHRRLTATVPGLCTVIAPRHPERARDIAAELSSNGHSVVCRSTGALPAPTTDIYLADTMGELGTIYRLSQVAFLGKSLTHSGGGQNPIEAVRAGAIVLAGPHHQNFREAYQALQRHGGLVQVTSADDIATAVARLFKDPDEIARVRQGANVALQSLSGALRRSVDALLPFLQPDRELQRAL
jgi:3-deoxy-D-manno-octulosonic-acid transferase